MRFLCKKCGAQSPGDISEVEIRDGALVFTCKACGASATLVESRAKGGAASAASGKPAEKGIVEPDEDELVDLGEATLSRMLGKKVRIVAEKDADPAEAAPAEPRQRLWPGQSEPREPRDLSAQALFSLAPSPDDSGPAFAMEPAPPREAAAPLLSGGSCQRRPRGGCDRRPAGGSTPAFSGGRCPGFGVPDRAGFRAPAGDRRTGA